MEMSPEVNELAAAMAKAQAEIKGAVKDAENPFYKSTYASLESVREACVGPLSKHGIAVFQSPSTEGSRVSIDTLLAHTSGQWVKGTMSAHAKDETPQAIGSAVSYLRRYALQSFAGVAPEDDDGEAAQPREGESEIAQQLRASLKQQRGGVYQPGPDQQQGAPPRGGTGVVTPKQAPAPTPPEQRAVDSGHGDTLLISEAQAKRYYAIAKKLGWLDEDLHHWLLGEYGYNSSREIPRRQYDEIVKALETGRV